MQVDAASSSSDDSDEEWLANCGADDETVARLGDDVLFEPPADSSDIMHTLAGVVACRVKPCRQALAPEVAHNATEDDEADLKNACSVLREHKMARVLPKPLAPPSGHSLHIEYDGQGNVTGARVLVMEPQPGQDDSALQRIARTTILRSGEAPPYIRVPEAERPTVTTTAQLHHLCAEQEFAFRLIMDTLCLEVERQRCPRPDAARDIPQLTMALLGTAGTMRMHGSLPV